KHDDRGNAVWHWAADTARTAMQSTSQLLRKLDLSALSLESDQPKDDEEPTPNPTSNVPKPSAVAETANKPKPKIDTRVRGFDPYSSNAGTAKRAAQAPPVLPQVSSRPA